MYVCDVCTPSVCFDREHLACLPFIAWNGGMLTLFRTCSDAEKMYFIPENYLVMMEEKVKIPIHFRTVFYFFSFQRFILTPQMFMCSAFKRLPFQCAKQMHTHPPIRAVNWNDFAEK